MNWIKFENSDKIELLQNFKYIGPLNPYKDDNMWSNIAYHSFKIKVPSDFELANYKTNNNTFKNVYLKNNEIFLDISFDVIRVSVLSKTNSFQILKIVVEEYEENDLSIESQRDLIITELYD